MKSVNPFVTMLAIGCFSLVAIAQTRNLTENADTEWSRFTCVRNSDASIECSGCVRVIDSDGDTREECSNAYVLRTTVNQNRANALGNAVRNRALSRRFAVDAGVE